MTILIIVSIVVVWFLMGTWAARAYYLTLSDVDNAQNFLANVLVLMGPLGLACAALVAPEYVFPFSIKNSPFTFVALKLAERQTRKDVEDGR